jgi:hypothetical protein
VHPNRAWRGRADPVPVCRHNGGAGAALVRCLTAPDSQGDLTPPADPGADVTGAFDG